MINDIDMWMVWSSRTIVQERTFTLHENYCRPVFHFLQVNKDEVVFPPALIYEFKMNWKDHLTWSHAVAINTWEAHHNDALILIGSFKF